MQDSRRPRSRNSRSKSDRSRSRSTSQTRGRPPRQMTEELLERELAERMAQVKRANETLNRELRIDDLAKSRGEQEKELMHTLAQRYMEYEKKRNKFIHNGMSQQTQLFLKRMASSKKLSNEQKNYPIVKYLNEICKLLLMNELEVLVWSVWLDKNGWQETGYDVETTMLMAAFAAKQYLNDPSDSRIFEAHLARNKPNFTHEFNTWVSNQSRIFRITPRELNKRWKKFNRPLTAEDDKDMVDFNFRVDEILQSTPYGDASYYNPKDSDSDSDDLDNPEENQYKLNNNQQEGKGLQGKKGKVKPITSDLLSIDSLYPLENNIQSYIPQLAQHEKSFLSLNKQPSFGGPDINAEFLRNGASLLQRMPSLGLGGGDEAFNLQKQGTNLSNLDLNGDDYPVLNLGDLSQNIMENIVASTQIKPTTSQLSSGSKALEQTPSSLILRGANYHGNNLSAVSSILSQISNGSNKELQQTASGISMVYKPPIMSNFRNPMAEGPMHVQQQIVHETSPRGKGNNSAFSTVFSGPQGLPMNQGVAVPTPINPIRSQRSFPSLQPGQPQERSKSWGSHPPTEQQLKQQSIMTKMENELSSYAFQQRGPQESSGMFGGGGEEEEEELEHMGLKKEPSLLTTLLNRFPNQSHGEEGLGEKQMIG